MGDRAGLEVARSRDFSTALIGRLCAVPRLVYSTAAASPVGAFVGSVSSRLGDQRFGASLRSQRPRSFSPRLRRLPTFLTAFFTAEAERPVLQFIAHFVDLTDASWTRSCFAPACRLPAAKTPAANQTGR